MINLTILNRFLLNCLPVSVKEAIIQVNTGLANQVIAEQIIKVIGLNLNHRRTWELSCELKQLVELRVRLVELVVITLGEFAVAASDKQVGVTEGTDIARGKIKALKTVELDQALSLRQQLLLYDLII